MIVFVDISHFMNKIISYHKKIEIIKWIQYVLSFLLIGQYKN